MPPRRVRSQTRWLVMPTYATVPLIMRLNFAMSRDLRRAALFLWMMPLSATRSSMLIAARTASAAACASPERIASSAFLTKVRAAVRYGRFRCRLRSATRMRFSADLLFAKVTHLVDPGHHSQPGTPINGPLTASQRW